MAGIYPSTMGILKPMTVYLTFIVPWSSSSVYIERDFPACGKVGEPVGWGNPSWQTATEGDILISPMPQRQVILHKNPMGWDFFMSLSVTWDM